MSVDPAAGHRVLLEQAGRSSSPGRPGVDAPETSPMLTGCSAFVSRLRSTTPWVRAARAPEVVDNPGRRPGESDRPGRARAGDRHSESASTPASARDSRPDAAAARPRGPARQALNSWPMPSASSSWRRGSKSYTGRTAARASSRSASVAVSSGSVRSYGTTTSWVATSPLPTPAGTGRRAASAAGCTRPRDHRHSSGWPRSLPHSCCAPRARWIRVSAGCRRAIALRSS